MHLERANSEVCSTTAFGLNTCNDMFSSTQAANHYSLLATLLLCTIRTVLLKQRSRVHGEESLQTPFAASQAVYQDIMEENQVWARLATLEQMCEEQGLDAHGGIARRSVS